MVCTCNQEAATQNTEYSFLIFFKLHLVDIFFESQIKFLISIKMKIQTDFQQSTLII